MEGIRLIAIYKECRNLTVSDNENAAAFLLRVLLGLTTEALLTEKSVPIPSRFKKTKWDDIGISLAAKIQVAIDFLDPTKAPETFQPIRVTLDQQSHFLASINTLHGYFHNRLLNPQGSDAMKAWDIWEPYLSAVNAAR